MWLVILMMLLIFYISILLTDRQVSRLRKAFGNNSSANLKLSKTHLSKIVQSGEFLGRLFGWFLKTSLSLIKNVLKTLAKNVLIPLALTAAASATGDENFSKENFDFWILDASF